MAEEQANKTAILVLGGGIAGMTAAIEAAEVGYPVYLVEKQPDLGGRVAQINQYLADTPVRRSLLVLEGLIKLRLGDGTFGDEDLA